jgi:hypothetical protein
MSIFEFGLFYGLEIIDSKFSSEILHTDQQLHNYIDDIHNKLRN